MIEREEGKSSGWYMILPNVTRGARDTDPVTNCKKNNIPPLLLKFYSGLTATWDGKVVTHCSTVSDLGSDANHVYGLFFGI